jgi:hypothetical protein
MLDYFLRGVRLVIERLEARDGGERRFGDLPGES